MKIIETRPREKGFVLWGHCQNLLDDPRSMLVKRPVKFYKEFMHSPPATQSAPIVAGKISALKLAMKEVD